jgi:hypothetical protein
MCVPFTYLIGWTKLDKWYYGVRYRKGCHPTDLWTKYFTSSTSVKIFRLEHGDPDIMQVRKTFNNQQSAYNWEIKVIRRMGAVRSEKWLNKQNHNIEFNCTGHSEATRIKMRESHIGLTESDTTKMKKSEQKKGILNPNYGKGQCGELNHMFGKRGELNHNYGKPCSDEANIKRSESYKHRIKITCQYCKHDFDVTHYNQWHGEKCKHSGNIQSLSAGTRGKKQTDSHKHNRSIAMKQLALENFSELWVEI